MKPKARKRARKEMKPTKNASHERHDNQNGDASQNTNETHTPYAKGND